MRKIFISQQAEINFSIILKTTKLRKECAKRKCSIIGWYDFLFSNLKEIIEESDKIWILDQNCNLFPFFNKIKK